MPAVQTWGIPSFAGQQNTPVPDVGSLVTGVADGGELILALVSEDSEGVHYLAFKDEGLQLIGDTELTWVNAVAGSLTIEPLEGQRPYALPLADGDVNGALLIDQVGGIGLQLIIKHDGSDKTWKIFTNLSTGKPLQGRTRASLRGYRICLVEAGRDPVEIFRLA